MAKTKFKVGDRVQIDRIGNEFHGKIGTIVRKGCASSCVVKIPGFDGHNGGIEDGTTDKWYVWEENLTKLPPEKKSMKIEVKQTKKKSKEIVYPCFRRNELPLASGTIVLFFSEDSGIVVDPNGSTLWETGYFSETWNPEVFSEPLQNYSATISSEP